MVASIASLILWLFVINLGITFGAGLYESQIVVPLWRSSSEGTTYAWFAEAARQSNAGLKFWVYVTTVPLTLLTLASLALAWKVPEGVRNWWLGAASAALIERLMTFAYFAPTMLKFIYNESFEESEVADKALQWVNFSYIRYAATLVGWLAALKALSLRG
jgi:hypothetical protein